MFLYTPKTDEQIAGLILAYQTIINNPITGFVNLLTSEYHFRYYFVGRHQENIPWNAVLNWTDELDIGSGLGKILLVLIIFGLYLYYTLCWVPWMLRIFINYKKIRQEAPIKLLELG